MAQGPGLLAGISRGPRGHHWSQGLVLTGRGAMLLRPDIIGSGGSKGL